VTEISANWRYVAVLNFYRTLSRDEALVEVQPGPADVTMYPTDKRLYVLHFASDMAFINREKLKVVYHNQLTDATVAVRSELEREIACPEQPVLQ
jgi:hypothetical protein